MIETLLTMINESDVAELGFHLQTDPLTIRKMSLMGKNLSVIAFRKWPRCMAQERPAMPFVRLVFRAKLQGARGCERSKVCPAQKLNDAAVVQMTSAVPRPSETRGSA